MVFQNRRRTILPQRDEIDISGEDQFNNNINGIANKLRKFTQLNKKTKYVTLLGMIAVWSVATSLDQTSDLQSNFFGSNSINGAKGSKGSRFSRLLKAFHAPEELHEWIDGVELGWDSPPPQWMVDLCPDVVDHFTRFPSLKPLEPKEINYLPFLPTFHAAQSVCTMKVLKDILSSINAQVYLHAGSHLGAVVHGQPIPWDDDVDMIMDFRKKDELKEICYGEGVVIHHSGVRLRCETYFNAYKVWIHYDGMKKYAELERFTWYAPFVDLFFFKIFEDGKFWEVQPSGNKHQESYAVEEYFPTRPYYFGGEYFFGPQAGISEDRYNLEVCVLADYNHRMEKGIGQFGHTNITKIKMLDCEQLSGKFPFRDSMKELLSTSGGGPLVQEIFPSIAANMDTVTIPSPTVQERREWAKQPDERGQELTDALLKDINKVEVDNSISPNRHCQGPLKVVELNLERGRRWMEASSLPNVKEADVIILNEMDIGMARSDNQHTTRLMAHYLGMNYAWGLEFVELTQGSREDRWNANGLYDFQGLHGNAFLTRCMISDTMIVRNDIGEYFSSKASSINAHGTEKRLGGRMGLFGRIVVDGTREVVVGSVHKLGQYEKEVKDYIGNRDAIVAGDQPGVYCSRIGLRDIVSTVGGKAAHNTWKASCNTLGNGRGDNICSNMGVVEDEVATKPCMTSSGFLTQIGDHALTSVVLGQPLVSEEGLEKH